MSKTDTLETSENSDIYTSWGVNETRADYPAFGPEYAQWKKTIPQDVQKIVLDYMVARNIWRSGGLERSILNKKLIDYQPYPALDYPQLREEMLGLAEKAAELVEPFLAKYYPQLVPHLQAIGLDGSALYRPKPQSDIDVWVMFNRYDRVAEQAMRRLHRQQLSKPGFIIDLRAITSELVLDEQGLMNDIHSLLMPHKVLHYFPPFDEEAHQQKIEELVNLARKSKANILRVSKMLVGVTKSQIT
ncbi:MAG: hypothetical protein M1607_01075 [Patescibacteria group bacterium]|nr:hypothetical protein [Patescibacteria group bacterium]